MPAEEWLQRLTGPLQIETRAPRFQLKAAVGRLSKPKCRDRELR